MNDMFNNNQNEENQTPQGAGYYYTPPVQNNNVAPPQPNIVDIESELQQKPKKKNKALVVIIAVVIACFVIAVGGILLATTLSFVDKQDSSSSSVVQDNDESTATVEKSESAAKTDSDGNLTAAGVAEKAMDSCVGISVYTQQSAYSYFYNYGSQSNSGEEQKSGEGSGVIMSQGNGKTYIITCAHVISDGSSFKVTLNDGTEYDAKMVGYDSQTDIGVLSIDKTGLQIASFGDSEDVELGEACVAIGCPGGLEFMNSITQGIVSALARPISSSIGYSNECIQVDAAINPGNSGGALFNMQGQVIGINSSKIASTEYEGMGFAVPSNTAINVANSLIKNGYVAGRAKLGIQYNSISSYNNANALLTAIEQKGYKDAKGTMVIRTINADSAFANTNVKEYDMIVAVDGDVLTSIDVMTSYLSNHSPGDECTLTMARVENNSLTIFEVKVKLIESKE